MDRSFSVVLVVVVVVVVDMTSILSCDIIDNGVIPMTIKEIVSWYIDSKQARLAPRTIENYRFLCERYCQALELTPVNIEKCYAQLLADGKERTAEEVYKLIRAACRKGSRYEIIDKDCSAVVDPVRHEQEMRDYWTVDEARAFLRATEGSEMHIAWLLMLGMGLRRGEACGLRWIDIELLSGYLTIQNQRYRYKGEMIDAKPKSRTSKRRLKMTEETRRLLVERRKERPWDTYVLEDVSPEKLRWLFRQACLQAHIRCIPLHGLRHTFAATSIETGGSLRVLQVVMGHASYQVTENHYAHVSEKAKAAAVEGVGRVISSDS